MTVTVTFLNCRDEEVDGGSFDELHLEGGQLVDDAGVIVATRWYEKWTRGPHADPSHGDAFSRLIVR